MGARDRIRQHVNPLGLRYLEPRAAPVSMPAHLGPTARVEVELGCADADFCFALARTDPRCCVVGLEIRDKMVARNRRRAAERGQANLKFGYVNLAVDLDRVFGPGSVDRFHLLFPDPWFKAKHRKRRVVDPQLCANVRRQLRPGGELHIATDVFEVALDAMAVIEDPSLERLGLVNLAGPWSFWRGNPFAVQSRRELTTLARGQRVWRLRYSASSSWGSTIASSSTSQRS